MVAVLRQYATAIVLAYILSMPAMPLLQLALGLIDLISESSILCHVL